MHFLMMRFISLVDEISFMLISSHYLCMRLCVLFLFLFTLQAASERSPLGESDNGLYTLTSQNFDGHVELGLHFVEFYAPWYVNVIP